MNTSLPCFEEMTERDYNQSVAYYDLLQRGDCKPCLAATFISVPLNLLSIFVIYKSQSEAVANGRLGDGPIHLIFLAISDILMAIAAWMRPVMFRISQTSRYCHIIPAFNVFAFVYNVTIVLSRWLTCFMTFKRCRCLFSVSYALKLTGKSTKHNLKNCLVYGFFAGMLQGLVIATTRLLLEVYGASKAAIYIFLTIHPTLFTALVLCFTVTMIVRKTFFRGDEASNPAIAKNFLNSIVAVAIVYVTTHSAGFIYLFLVRTGDAKAHFAVVVRQAIICINMFANFFIYLFFSKKFRRTLKRWLLSLG